MKQNNGIFITQYMIFLLFLSSVLGFSAWGVQTNTTDSLSFKRLTTKEGMPASSVNIILEDSRGFMWFGTGDGLVRYDGHEFNIFRPDSDDPNSISHNSILCLKEDVNSNIWVGTDEGGLNLWHRETEKFSHYFHDPNDEASLSDNAVSDLLINDDGTIWVSTIGGGLNLFDPKTGRFERLVSKPYEAGSIDHDSPNDNLIRVMIRSRTGIIWLGMNFGGLNKFDPQTRNFRYYEHNPDDPGSISHNRIDSIGEGTDGILWLGTEQGLCSFDPQSGSVERFDYDPNDPNALQNPTIESLFVDHKGNVLAGTDGGGLYFYNLLKKQAINILHNKYDERTLVSNVIRSIYQDSNGDFWMGHFPSGVSYANKLNAPFRVYRNIPGEDNSLSDDRVLSVIEEESGNLWVGTDRGGLNYFDRASGQWTNYKHDPNDESSLGGRAAVCLLKDHNKQLWVGVWNGGLNKFDPETGTFRRYLPERKRSNSLHSPHIWRIVEDHEKQLWVATVDGGISRYLPEEDGFITYRHDPDDPGSISHDSVWSVQIMQDGTLWAGTSDGICRWEPSTDSWTNYYHDANDPQSLSFNMITDMLEDKDGNLWIATAGGGINRFDKSTEKFEAFTIENGLPSNMIRGFVEDQDGFLWLLTNKGLCRFDYEANQCRTYDENIPGTFSNGNARYCGRSGELFIGSTEGLIIYNPRDIHPNDVASSLVFTCFEIFNQAMLPGREDSPLQKSITETDRIEISSIHSMISFQFALLNYRSSSRNQYQYMLEGFESDWRMAGPERKATYTNLNPGNYKLHVKATNNDGVWDKQDIDLDLIILPMWWQTKLFRWGIIIGLLGIGWIVSSWRSRLRLREVEYERKLALERQQAAEALNKSEISYREIFNASNDGIIIHNLETGDFLDVNDSVCRMTGYKREDILNFNVGDISEGQPPYSNKDAENLIQKTAEEGVQTFEWLFLRKNGELYWGDVTLKRVVLGGQDRVMAVIRDITARKRAEEELHHLRNYLSNIINSMPSVLIGVDLDGNVTQWNQQAEKETGINAAQAAGRILEDVFPNLQNQIEKIKSAIRERQTCEDAKVARQVGGEIRYENVTIYPLVANGVEGAVIRVDDVTEHVRLEEMMIQSEKMLSVGGLAAGMAHEINNPLAGIIQNTQVLRNRITGAIPKNQIIAEECGTDIKAIEKYMNKRGLFDMIETITESGLRASKIVGNMLSFSRRSDSDFSYHNLSEMLDKAIELASNDYDLKKKYDFRKINIIRGYDENMPEVLCEGIKIQQVILNLLKNAAQAMNEEEDKTEAPCITLRLLQQGDNACMEVEDNGPGMTEEIRKRVFEPFYTTKAPGIGTGLGLSVSYFIITENHNGAMSVESSPGNGAKFTIQLPINIKEN